MTQKEKLKEATILCADEYISTNFGLDREETNREIFERGAEWAQKDFINSLWHDATKEPDAKLDAWLIMQTGKDLYETVKYGGYNEDGGQTWQQQAKKGNILRWCYLSDLLPKEGGEG